MEKICIDIRAVSKTLGKKKVIDDITFSVKQGEIFGLLGHNGAGKSTTMECILGLKKPEEGHVSILGEEPRKKRRTLFEQVGVQLQSSSYQANIKVEEICQEITALYKNPVDYHKLLEQFGLMNFKKHFVEKLSGGEKQKLSLILALIPKPKVLFLDELTTGLDVSSRREVWSILKELKQKGMTILMSSHYMDEVEVLCDRIGILKSGKLIVSGTVNEVISKTPYEKLEDAYLFYTKEGRKDDKIYALISD